METNGCRILLLNTKLNNLNGYLTGFVREGFSAVLGEGNVVVSDYHRCLEDFTRHRCNTVVCFDGQELHRLMTAKLRLLASKMVLWLTEDPYECGANRRNIDLFDVVFTNDKGSVDAYLSPRVHHLPLAASTEHHDLPVIESDDQYLHDVFFAGVAWPNRVELLKHVVEHVKGLRYRFLLPWNQFLKKPDVGLPEFEFHHRLSNKDLARVQNRSKIILYLHRDFSSSGETRKSTTPGPRLFETALAGGFQLAEDVLPEIDEYFERDREIAYFRSREDCIDRIRHFLAHPDQRIAMARAAQERARMRHTYRHRAEVVLERVNAQQPRQRISPDAKRQTRILYVLHNVAGKPPFGGAELHTQVTQETLSDQFKSWVYYPDMVVPGARRMVLRSGSMAKTIMLATPHDGNLFADGEREHAFAQILERERIDVVHFMHLLHHPFSLVDVAKRHGVATLLTLHDYYLVCPRFNLIDAGGRFCWTSEPTLASCDIDLRRADHMESGSQAARRAAIATVLDRVDAVTCVSRSQWEIIRAVYPQIEDRVSIISPGITVEQFNRRPKRARPSNRPLVAAAIGNFTMSKGADTLIYVFNHFRHEKRVEFVILGRVDSPYSEILRALKIPNVRVVGEYTPETLPDMLSDVDVGLIASIWAETFVLTLSECWAAGVVPIVADIGALRDRVTHGVNGLKAPPDSPGHIASAIERLLAEPELLPRLRDGISLRDVPTVEPTTREYEKIYAALVDSRLVANRHVEFSPEDFPPIPNMTRRLYPGWARHEPGYAQSVPAAMSQHPLVLSRRVAQYYATHGLPQTVRRTLDRLRGKP